MLRYRRTMTLMDTTTLSGAELRSLAAVARYESSSSAATARGVSEQTLKNELSSAYRKLGVRSRTGAFAVLGWLRPPILERGFTARPR